MLFQTHIALPIALVLVACAHTPTPEETARSRVEVETAGQGGSPDGMVRITGGTFTMGSDESDSHDNEKPLTRVTLSPYYIDRTQVTVGEYRKCSREVL